MIEFQLLWYRVRIATASDDVAEVLRYLAQTARQLVPIREDVTFDVIEVAGGYEILENVRSVATVPDALGVLDEIYARVHTAAFTEASDDGWIRIHAALAEVNGQRIVLTGRAGVGKTTLALRLLYDGARVHADESVLLRDGDALAVPRPFHLKPGTEAHVPEVAGLLDELPTLAGMPPIAAFDPGVAGFDWRIDAGAVDAVITLHRAETSSLEPTPAIDAVHGIVEEVFLFHESKATVVREVSVLLRDAPCYRLALADPRDATALLHELRSPT